MNNMFYAQNVFASPLDPCNNYVSSLDGYLAMEEAMCKLDYQYYPTPVKAPVQNQQFIHETIPQDQQIYSTTQSDTSPQFLSSMMMVPPLGHYEAVVNDSHNFDIDFVDKFIAQHEAALNFTEKVVPPQETSWSHWTFPREISPECEGLSSSKSTVPSSHPSSPEIKTVKLKLTKTGRRGRGKGVKNKVKKQLDGSKPIVTKPKPEVEGALYVCQHENCGRSFTRPYNLTSHMRTHTTDRPYACSNCGRRFARQHDRNRHEKLHWGIRPYACHNCHKSFARMDALNRHLRMENSCTSVHL